MVVSKEIKNYLKSWISSDEVKSIFTTLLAPILTQDSMEELLKKYVQESLLERISELESKVETQQTHLEKQNKKIELLETAAAIRDNTLDNWSKSAMTMNSIVVEPVSVFMELKLMPEMKKKMYRRRCYLLVSVWT